jgi:hypothetical protein
MDMEEIVFNPMRSKRPGNAVGKNEFEKQKKLLDEQLERKSACHGQADHVKK